jgi:hypothetical protein
MDTDTIAEAPAAPVFAIVTEGFDGCRDGEFKVTEFAAGDALEGDIAAAALQLGKARACTGDEFRAAQATAAATPDQNSTPTMESVMDANNRLRMALDDANAGRVEAEAERDAAARQVLDLQAEMAATKAALNAAATERDDALKRAADMEAALTEASAKKKA